MASHTVVSGVSRRRPVLLTLAASAMLILTACGSGDATGPGGGGDGFMTARINGEAWSSDGMYVDVGVQATGAGIYIVSGTRAAGVTTVSLMLTNVTGPGTYPLGTGANVAGGTALVANAESGWITPLSGAAGAVTIATISEDRITGAFSFTAAAATGSATGSRVVSEGRFDLPLVRTGTQTPVPETARNSISATIAGESWHAATVALQANPDALWGFSASNTDYSLTLAIAQPTGPGTYTLSSVVPLRLAQVGTAGFGPPENCCWSSALSGTGTITIATWTGTRATGTFSFTIGATAGTAASGPIAVTSGSFDVGIP